MSDEEAMFEVWWQLNRRDRWKELYPDEVMPEHFSEGFKKSMLIGWLGRASLHVTWAKPKGKP